MSPTRAALCALVLAWLVAVPIARAQGDVTRAREHFSRGLALFDEGDYDASLAELSAAYAASPEPRVLYNLGRVHAMRGDAVRAADAYQRFLDEAGAPEARRLEVEARLAEQRERIGTLDVIVDPVGAEIVVDGVLVVDAQGVPVLTPLATPLRLNAGRHRVGARATGRQPTEREIEVAGNTHQQISITLPPVAASSASLRIRSPLHDVLVFVDGQPVGYTPFAAAVPLTPGEHFVEGRRLGYRSAQQVTHLAAGVESELELRLEIDADAVERAGSRLRLALPDVSQRLEIDGLAVTDVAAHEGTLAIPPGRHSLRIEVAERARTELDIRVDPASELALTPTLEWTPEARERRLGDAGLQRTLGWVAAITGAVVSAAMVPLFVHADERIPQLHVERRAAWNHYQGCEPPCDVHAAEAAYDAVQSSLTTWEIAYGSAGVGIGVGALLVLGGVLVIVLAPSDEDIDASASVRVSLGAGSIALRGTF